MSTTSNPKKREVINFVVDETGEGKEDFYDTLLAQDRQNEPRETLDEARERVLTP